ncbi:DUF4037 domain-containing protein [Pseudomonas fulva]|uniref:DUF4037 domain-containing protein n=1 Tax=Pseudomonas fulva TaxID=47880 RepID=UPI0018AA30CE|nr:DUF4037 domain-containing protein [Pseudomonas fulva]MBF8774065.1 DUF4037 domain-containing protein [Pseudomonas fulva]
MNFDLMKKTFGSDRARVLSEVASLYMFNPNTFAITVGASSLSDVCADIDVFVYCAEPTRSASESTLLTARAGVQVTGHSQQDYNDGNERWLAPSLDVHVDIVRRCPLWFSYSIDKVVKYHRVQAGYSTCLLHELVKSIPIYDRACWFSALRDSRMNGYGYPVPLKHAVLHKNYPLLRTGQNSWLNKAEASYRKSDTLAVFKYCSHFLSSYIDILFAINEKYHPGEKQLMEHALSLSARPADLERLVRSFLISQHGDVQSIFSAAHALVDSLEPLIDREMRMDF